MDGGLFFELTEENKVIYNQVPVKTLLEDMEKLNNGCFTTEYFGLCDEKEIDTDRFFKDSNKLAKLIDKTLDKYDDLPAIKFTGNIFRCLRNFKLVNRSEDGRSANEDFFWNMRV